ncbi:MAG: hypothetical protein LQ352_000614 [Teloschistes flavicans]|nr:MAG: hypothetical protein LQ352_000614 [Teloschistes flavicans]
MYTKYLLAGVTAVVAVTAQSSTATAPIAFTSIPARVTAGSDVTIYWGGGDANVPVTIFLRQGADENNLDTVGIVNGKSIKLSISRIAHLNILSINPTPGRHVPNNGLAGSATGHSAIWHVPKNIQNRNDYTYYIVQGLTPTPDTSNYSGRFGAIGGVASSDASSPSTPATSTSAGSAGGVVVGGAGSPTSASAGTQTAIASMNASVTTTVASGNATTTTVPLGGAAGTGAVGSGASGASGAATGTAMVRNTTMSMATLSATSSSSSAAATTGGGSSTSSGSGGSSTGAPSSGGVSVMMDAASFASPLALVLSAFAAVVYLG